LGDALAKAGNTPEAKGRFLAAAEHARASVLPAHLGRAALGYGGRFPWLRAGDDRQLVPLLEEALRALGGETSALRARVLARLAGALRDQPSLEPRASFGHQAVELARRLDDPHTLGYALIALAAATWGPEIEELAAILEEVSHLADETGDVELALQARWPQYIVNVTRGEPEQITKVSDEFVVLSVELKQPSQRWYGAVLRSHWRLFQGDFTRAEKLMEEGLGLGERAQSWDAGFSYRTALFDLRRQHGRLAEIEELMRRSVDEYPGYRSFRCMIALLKCELGREDEALRAFEELASTEFAAFPRDMEWLFCLCILAEVAAHLQDGDRAATLYRLLLPYACLNAVNAGETIIGSVSRYLGIAAATMSRSDLAAQHFENALEANDRLGARPWVAHTLRDYGCMRLTRTEPRDGERAQQLLSQALAIYHELGMDAYAARTSSLLPTARAVTP
jgi:tetratricopeptide (TPR) repeat protein